MFEIRSVSYLSTKKVIFDPKRLIFEKIKNGGTEIAKKYFFFKKGKNIGGRQNSKKNCVRYA